MSGGQPHDDPPTTEPEGGWPGDDLALRVAGHIDREGFARQGRLAVADLERALLAGGRRLEDAGRLLDFGCGSGRLLSPLASRLTETEIWGVDVDPEAIAWCQEHIPAARFAVSGALPPLDLPSGHFDVVVANSVFTHLDATYQDAWLHELRRVTAPGGTLVLSVHGEYAFRLIHDPHLAAGTPGVERWRRQLETDGIVFWADDGLDPDVFPDYYHTTFHAVWYLYEHWGSRFELVAHLSRGLLDHQDYVVLRRPTPERPAMPVPHVSPPPARPRTLPSALVRARRELGRARRRVGL